jgi:hypothetical protein
MIAVLLLMFVVGQLAVWAGIPGFEAAIIGVCMWPTFVYRAWWFGAAVFVSFYILFA